MAYRWKTALRLATSLVLACAILFPAHAASKKKQGEADAASTLPEVPADDIFGFTTPTDTGKVGDFSLVNENDGRIGGQFQALNPKLELGYTFAEEWWIAGSAFGAWNRVRRVPAFDDVSAVDFDGMSFEVEHRLIKRAAGNPFAVALSFEPRWSRIDGTTGRPSTAYTAQLKLFVDAVVVPEKLYWATNVIWAPQQSQEIDNRSNWVTGSFSLVSAALTYQFSHRFFAGVEARHLASYDSEWVTDRLGYAVYVGPTLLCKITDKLVFNATWQPQVSGRSATNPGLRFDLDNFERAQFRAKLSLGLN